MKHKEHRIPFKDYQLYGREYPGKGPAIILLHGFPDNFHLYDYLLPHLKGRHVIVFDFLGWGLSDKPKGYKHTATKQIAEIAAVVDYFKLKQIVLVAHDASGPPAIDWALEHPDKIAQLVLLNTYYNWMPTLRAPEAIFLYSTPVFRNITRWITGHNKKADERLYRWQVGRFMRDPSTRQEMLDTLYPIFQVSRPAFWSLNNDLIGTTINRHGKLAELKNFSRPVRIIFGNDDPYLNRGVAKRFHQQFPGSELFLIPSARHYVQVDEPKRVADLILKAPGR